MSDPTDPPAAALDGVRVVAVTDDSGCYAARLLAELGASVTRLLPNEALRRGMHLDEEPATRRYLDRSQRLEPLPPGTGAAREGLLGRLAEADLLLEAGPNRLLERLEIDRTQLLAERPDLVWVRITPFGTDGAAAELPGSDLVCSAMAGFLTLGGWPDRPPTRAWGDQSWKMASLHAAAGALLALFERQLTGLGQEVCISVQEAVATALENSLQYYDLLGVVRSRIGAGYAEAGTGVYRCADGFVYLMVGRLSTRQGWSNLMDWLSENEVPGSPELRDDRWTDKAYRETAEAQTTFRAVFERFAGSRLKTDLYVEAQRRKIAMAPVNSPEDLLRDEHLAARDFFVTADGETLTGAPYRLSRTPWRTSHAAR